MRTRGRVIGAASGALGLGSFAAALGLCCTVPWAVALLGVTGAVAFARLAFLLPYALIGAAVLLGVGFWYAYQKPVACVDGTCEPANRRPLRLIVWLAALIVAALSAVALATDNTSAHAYAVMDETGMQLREDFNRAKGSVRLLFVVDPICPGCLRGLDDMNEALLANTQDPRLQTFVVHVPVLKPPAKAQDIPPAAELLRNPHVHHYWNSSGSFGWQLSESVGLQRGDEPVYAWDVWLIYGPDATWNGVSPPKPRLLMHQLRALRGSKFPRLDSKAFAREVHELLAQLPPTTASQ